MKTVKPVSKRSYDGYYACVDSRGRLKCSCGEILVREDKDTLVCPGGYPRYRADAEEIVTDKFGNILLKEKSHERSSKPITKNKTG